MNLTAFATRDALMAAAAERMAAALRDGVARSGSACAALSGGSTPAPAYRALAGQSLDWAKITIALVDERFVPPNDPVSNQALIQSTLTPAFDAGARLAPMFFPAATVAQSADQADQRYAGLNIDVALMGMGDDGHTASWFPGVPALGNALDLNNPRSVMALNAPQAAGSAERLTLTRSALARSGRIVLLITGDQKRARLEQAVQHDDAPVSALFAPHMPAPEVLWAA